MTVISKVKELTRTKMSDDLLSAYIEMMNPVDGCLSSYPESVQELSKALAVSHLITMADGQVTSDTSPTGASVSFAFTPGKGILSTGFGQQLSLLPTANCFMSFFSSPEQFAFSVGRKC